MSDTLFDIPETKSPRLLWLEKHCVKTEHTEFTEGDEDEFGCDLWPWYAFIGVTHFADAKPNKCAGGETEQDAIAKLAISQDWKLWNE